MKSPFVFWLIAINALAFAAFGWDKLAARRGARRIPERRLLWLAFLCGAPGAWIGSHVFRHKRSKSSFRLKMTLVTALELAIMGAALWWMYGLDGTIGA